MHGDNNALWYAPMRRGYVKDIDYRGLTVASLICQDATGLDPLRIVFPCMSASLTFSEVDHLEIRRSCVFRHE